MNRMENFLTADSKSLRRKCIFQFALFFFTSNEMYSCPCDEITALNSLQSDLFGKNQSIFLYFEFHTRLCSYVYSHLCNLPLFTQTIYTFFLSQGSVIVRHLEQEISQIYLALFSKEKSTSCNYQSKLGNACNFFTRDTWRGFQDIISQYNIIYFRYLAIIL